MSYRKYSFVMKKTVLLVLFLVLSSSAFAESLVPGRCDFDDSDVYFLATNKVIAAKTFSRSGDGIEAVVDCEEAGYLRCHVTKEPRETGVPDPSALIFGLWNTGFIKTKAQATGYRFAPKSRQELQQDLCPQLSICSVNASGSQEALLNKMNDAFGCVAPQDSHDADQAPAPSSRSVGAAM